LVDAVFFYPRQFGVEGMVHEYAKKGEESQAIEIFKVDLFFDNESFFCG